MLPIQTLQRHEKAIYSLALWHDTLYSGSEDMEIKVWQMKLFLSCILLYLLVAVIQALQTIAET